MNLNRSLIGVAGLCLIAVIFTPSGIHDLPILIIAVIVLVFSLRKNEESHFLVFALLSAFPIFTLSKWYEPAIINQSTETRTETLQAELNIIDGVLNNFFNNNAAALEALKLLVSSEPTVTNERYQNWLNQLLPESRNNFLNIAFSRDLIIEYVYPENTVNQPVIGVNQREIPNQGDNYKRVLENQNPITMGPVMLVQGVPGIIYVNPIRGDDGILFSAVLSLETLKREIALVVNENSNLSVNIVNGPQQLELFTSLPSDFSLKQDHFFDDITVAVSLNSPLIVQTANRTKLISRSVTMFFWLLLTALLSWQSTAIRQRDQQKKIIEQNQESLLSAQRIGQTGSWQYINNRYELSQPLQELVGINSNSLSTLEVGNRLHPGDGEKLASLWASLKAGEQVSGTLEHRILVYNQYRWFEHRIVVNANGTSSGTLRDINLIKEREQQVTLLESFDALTGASNRRYFQLLVEQNIALCDRHNSLIALAIVSIDKFRVVNEQYGQDIGDMLLKQVSQRMRDVTRKSDLISRLSGDTFAVAFVGLQHSNQATIAIEQMHDTLRQPYENSPVLSPQFTIAVSMYPDDGNSFDTLLQQAEQALSNAKANFRGSVQFYSKNLTKENQRRQQIINKLPTAIKQDDLYMVYQPRVDSSNHAIVGVEALVRWRDTDLGLVSPGEFIPLAESTHLIIEIGEWVIASVFGFFSKHKSIWPENIVISINLSPKQLEDKHLVTLLRSLLDKHQLQARNFEFEVTEHSIAVESDIMLKNMATLSRMGFLFALDDFGTGYSNLGILQALPLHVLKIDMTFIKKLGIDSRSDALVDAIVNMSHTLNLTTVAEGVESASQVDYLKRIGCEQLQGYYFFKPLSQSDLLSVISSTGEQ